MLCLRFAAAFFFLPCFARADLVDHSDVFEPVFATGGRADGPGLALFDLEGDGDLDLAVAHGRDGLRLYENLGEPDFEFENVSAASGLPDAMDGAVGIAAADLDRDGDTDLAVADGDLGVRIFENRGGVFVDISAQAGTLGLFYPSSLAAADLDGDSLTDLWVGTMAYAFDGGYQSCGPSRIFHNQSDLGFVEVSAAWGVQDLGCTLAVLASDYDRDGDADLMSANDFGRFVVSNRLYRNDGLQPDGTVRFTDVSESSGFGRELCGMGLATADVDADGLPDYFTTNIGRDVLLLGQADGTFVEAADAWGVQATFMRTGFRATWGAAFIDLEADGEFELAVASSAAGANPEIADDPRQTSMLLTGIGTAAARDDALLLGIVPDDSSKALAVGDFDADGDDDFVTGSPGGLVHLYRNDAEAGPVVSVSLVGTVSNPDGLGALLTLRCDGTTRVAEVTTGGSYASTHSSIVRIPLEGCPDGAVLDIAWPSGLVEAVDVVAGGEALTRVEPAFVEVDPPWIPADGASTSTVRISPRAPDGSLRGAGLAVGVTATAGVVGAVADLGDGTYETTIQAPLSPGDAAITIEIDGEVLLAHPRVRFFAGDRTTVRASPGVFAAGRTDVAVGIVPRDAAGALDGAGRAVTLDVIGGSVVSGVDDLGDGRYEAVVRGDGGADLTISARVDAAPRGPSVAVVEIEATSPSQSVVRATPVAFDRALFGGGGEEPNLSLRVEPRDGLGRPLPDVEGLDFEIFGAGGVVEPTFEGFGGLNDAYYIAVMPASVAIAQAPLEVRIDGMALDHRPVPFAYDDPAEVLAVADAARSRLSAWREVVYADDEDYSWAVVHMRDSRGDALPWVEGLSVSSPGLTLVEERLLFDGTEYIARMRSAAGPGTVPLELLVDDLPFGPATSVVLVAELTHDPAALRATLCLEPPAVAANGLEDGRILVRPHDDGFILVGSNVALRVTVDGEERPLDYSIPGGYYARAPGRDEPGSAVVEAELVGTGRRGRHLIEYYDPAEGPKGSRPACVELRDADAGVDSGPEADAGDDEDAAPEADAAPGQDAGTDAGASGVVRPRGGGCGCGVAGSGGSAGALLLLAALPVYRSNRYPRKKTSPAAFPSRGRGGSR